MYSTATFIVGQNQCGNYKNVGDCYNREHSMPKSWFDEASPMKSDAFHIYPTDGKVNGQRSNYPYGECANGTSLSNGSIKGLGKLGKWNSDMLAGNKYPAYTTWAVNLLMKWNEQDPVSQKEIDRNEAVYSYQHNRNPFIDHPELADYIWGDKQRSRLFIPAQPQPVHRPSGTCRLHLGRQAERGMGAGRRCRAANHLAIRRRHLRLGSDIHRQIR